jgi:hypothetical protein
MGLQAPRPTFPLYFSVAVVGRLHHQRTSRHTSAVAVEPPKLTGLKPELVISFIPES